MANEFKHDDPGTSMTQAEFIAVGLHVLNAQATGDLIYASSATQLSRLGIGSTNAFLQVVAGVPSWVLAPTLGGTLTLNGQVFDAGASVAQVNTTGAGTGFVVQSTQDAAGGASIGFTHVSASPAVNDEVGTSVYTSRNSVGVSTLYGYLGILIADPTSTTESGKFFINLSNAGDLYNSALTLSGAGALWTDLSVDTLTYKVSGTQVVGAQGATVADATDAASVILRLNDLLARVRTHGLIAT